MNPLVAACSRAGIGYTWGRRFDFLVLMLRLAHGLGSDTLTSKFYPNCSGCGLLTGWDRIHCRAEVYHAGIVAACSRAGIGYTVPRFRAESPTCCGLLTGWDRIHWAASGAAESGCGLLTGWDRIHLLRLRLRRRRRCGLLAGWDRIHSRWRQAAPCLLLRLAHGLGSDTLWRVALRSKFGLRLAHGLGSDTLHCAGDGSALGCGLLTGWDRIHSSGLRAARLAGCGLLTGRDRITLRTADRVAQLAVAACSRAGIGYTESARRSRSRCRLRLAHGLGSDTLQTSRPRRAALLRLAHGLGSDTLLHTWADMCSTVAACSRAGIGYTRCANNRRQASVAACSRAGIGYT